MPKYLLQASYTTEGLKGLLKEGGSSRRATVEQLARGLGGEIEAFYYAFGEHDAYAIAEMPDETTATAVALTIGATGLVAIKTTVLITPEAVDEAVKKTIPYRPPGT